jgi:hypothetical protein
MAAPRAAIFILATFEQVLIEAPNIGIVLDGDHRRHVEGSPDCRVTGLREPRAFIDTAA